MAIVLCDDSVMTVHDYVVGIIIGIHTLVYISCSFHSFIPETLAGFGSPRFYMQLLTLAQQGGAACAAVTRSPYVLYLVKGRRSCTAFGCCTVCFVCGFVLQAGGLKDLPLWFPRLYNHVPDLKPVRGMYLPRST